jgi:hypothetical protein
MRFAGNASAASHVTLSIQNSGRKDEMMRHVIFPSSSGERSEDPRTSERGAISGTRWLGQARP